MFANVTSFAKFAKISYREHFHAHGRQIWRKGASLTGKMADGLEVLAKLRDAFCERPFKDADARTLLSNSKLLGCLLTQLEEDKDTLRSWAIRPVVHFLPLAANAHAHCSSTTLLLIRPD